LIPEMKAQQPRTTQKNEPMSIRVMADAQDLRNALKDPGLTEANRDKVDVLLNLIEAKVPQAKQTPATVFASAEETLQKSKDSTQAAKETKPRSPAKIVVVVSKPSARQQDDSKLMAAHLAADAQAIRKTLKVPGLTKIESDRAATLLKSIEAAFAARVPQAKMGTPAKKPTRVPTKKTTASSLTEAQKQDRLIAGEMGILQALRSDIDQEAVARGDRDYASFYAAVLDDEILHLQSQFSPEMKAGDIPHLETPTASLFKKDLDKMRRENDRGRNDPLPSDPDSTSIGGDALRNVIGAPVKDAIFGGVGTLLGTGGNVGAAVLAVTSRFSAGLAGQAEKFLAPLTLANPFALAVGATAGQSGVKYIQARQQQAAYDYTNSRGAKITSTDRLTDAQKRIDEICMKKAYASNSGTFYNFDNQTLYVRGTQADSPWEWLGDLSIPLQLTNHLKQYRLLYDRYARLDAAGIRIRRLAGHSAGGSAVIQFKQDIEREHGGSTLDYTTYDAPIVSLDFTANTDHHQRMKQGSAVSFGNVNGEMMGGGGTDDLVENHSMHDPEGFYAKQSYEPPPEP
jgi:hypothetical protein